MRSQSTTQKEHQPVESYITCIKLCKSGRNQSQKWGKGDEDQRYMRVLIFIG